MSLPDPQRSRAVLIGTSEYDDHESLPQLEAVTANLADLQSLFSAADLWGLPPENCTVLLNCVNPREVLDAVHDAAQAAQDALIVYFAGHGLRGPDDDELCLALRTTAKDRMYSALWYGDLRCELLHAGVHVPSKVVLLDCCYSGVAMRDTMSASDDVAERARIEGTYLMTASASTALALARKGDKHTAFTGEIIDAISAGIPDGPDLLNMGTLRLLGQHSHVDYLLKKAVGLAGVQPSQLAELAWLLREQYAAESRWLVSSAIRAEAASGADGPGNLISLVGALWSAGLGEEIERTLSAAEIPLSEADALALAKALNSAGRSELAITLYLRGLEAVAALEDEEVAAIVRTARECGRVEDAATLVQAALSRRGTGAQYTKLAMALWAVEPSESLDAVVLEAAASKLDDAELIAFAANLRAGGHAKAPFELYRKAAPGRSAGSLVDFIESLRAFGRPVDALRVLNESATWPPADLARVLVKLWRRGGYLRTDDVDRLLELVLRRPPEDLAVVIVGLREQGIEELASQCREAVVQGGSAQAVANLVAAFIDGGADELAHECAVRLITEIDDGPVAFARWLRGAPESTAALFLPVVAALDHRHALAVARALDAANRPELVGDLLERIRFDGIEGMFVAFHAVNWPEGLNVFFTSKAQQILDEVYAECAQLVRSGRHEAAGFLISQSALRRPAEEIPAMLDVFLRSRDESAVAAVNEAVGAHREPADVATILNVLNLKGRRMQKPVNEIMRFAAGRSTADVGAIAAALRARTLSYHEVQLTAMHRDRFLGR
jgi:Caspase domain